MHLIVDIGRKSIIKRHFWTTWATHWISLQCLWFIDPYIPDLNGWYFVSSSQVLQHGGGGLLTHHKGSLWRALQTVYPQHPWISFPQVTGKRPYIVSKGQYTLLMNIKRVST